MFSFDENRFRQIIREEIADFEAAKAKQNEWPPLLSRKQLMEFLGVKANKASELLNRADCPVIREFGHPRVPTHLLMKWIDEHTEW